MAYNTITANEFVDNVERTVLEQLKDSKPNLVRSLFSSVPWNPGDGEKVTFNSIALSGFAPRVVENDNYSVVNPSKGNELSKTQIQFGDKLQITRRMMKFNNRYARAKFDAQDLVGRLKASLDLEMTMQAFAEADVTTFTPLGALSAYNIATSDGQALASTAHVYGGVTFSNILNNATQAGGLGPVLSIGNLTSAITAMGQNTPDDFGTNLSVSPDTIVIANNQHMIVKCHQMFGSSLTPESANNAVNYYGGTGQFKVVALNYGHSTPTGTVNTTAATTNMNRWMVADSRLTARSWQLMMAEEPTTEQKFVSEDNVIASILVTQFASYGIVQPQGTMYSLSITQPTLS